MFAADEEEGAWEPLAMNWMLVLSLCTLLVVVAFFVVSLLKMRAEDLRSGEPASEVKLPRS